MKKRYLFTLLTILPLLLANDCDPPPPPPSLAEQIQKVWKATNVKHNNAVVYAEGTGSNAAPGYANFRLDLSNNSKVDFADVNGNRCSGDWELAANNTKLILKNLSPQPTGTNGAIEYSLSNPSESQLTLKRTTSSVKTGGSTNEYVLVPNP